MFNNVTTIRQQHNKIQFNMTTSKMLVMLITFPLLLSTLTSARSTLAESEINNLNAIDNLNLPRNDTTAVIQTKSEARQYPFNAFMMPPPVLPPSSQLHGCPLCDSSVYSYCSHKLMHDSCCCDFPGATIYQRPPQCAYNRCMLLYAKSCYEYSLIKNCCCNSPY